MPKVNAIVTNLSDGIDRKTLRALRHRFMQINEARYQRTLSALNNHQQTFLEALPLLLHVNHPLLPGYMTNNTPCGVSHFEPEKKHIRAVKSIANTFTYHKRNQKESILNISVMGSIGTIAHSRDSDMDFWICHRTDLLEDELKELEQKLNGIQKWAESLSLEVYFFLMNVEKFRAGQRKDISSAEDCGSAQHYLLLDEFYRTSMLLAGCYPIWWLVPTDQEKKYSDYANTLIKKRFIHPEECIDFGGIPVFPAGEFIGAGMWQLYKGIDSPYKSVIKIMLTEVYASEYPNVKGLSLLFKKKVYDGEIDLDELDPYILLYRKIEAYLKKRKEPERLKLLRHCLYFKINENMSKPIGKASINWRRQVMQNLISEWGWNKNSLELLDGRKTWKVKQVLQQRKDLVDELNFSYRFLSRFAKDNGFSASINQHDMSLLGRKLYAAFERKSGKIEFINPNIAPNITEEHLTLIRQANYLDEHIRKNAWSIYSGAIKQEYQNEYEPINRSRSVVELLAWCYFNNLIDHSTLFTLYPGESDFTEQELRQILVQFFSLYPNRLQSAKQERFNHAARPERITLFINVGQDPMREWNKRGIHRLTDHTDPFNYSGMHKNLVLSIDQITMNTWHECTTQHYDQQAGIINCILDFLRNFPPKKSYNYPTINVFCFCPTRPQSITNRIEELFTELLKYYYQKKSILETRYIFEIGSYYHVLQLKNHHPRIKTLQNQSALQKHLGAPQKTFSPIVFDHHVNQRDPLPALCKYNQVGLIQVFYRKKDRYMQFYLLDEKGSLVYFIEHPTNNQILHEKSVLQRLNRFLRACKKRRTTYLSETELSQENDKITFYEIFKGDYFYLEERVINTLPEKERYHNVEVIIEKSKGEHLYKIYCDHEEFTEYEHGDKVFEAVANHIIGNRAGHTPYPVYITDIDLSSLLQNHEILQTSFFLQQKLALENRLNKALY